ncbi:MAG: transporter substrate-binding domain-containing protein [Eubacterium sp.]|nr:transporter substrate-binding domain-containing protein [Eubacterium sp.]
MKKIIALVLSVALIMCIFAGCSSKNSEKYSDTTLIIGYTEETAPFLKVDKNGKATGFSADLWKKIFDGVKGDLKDYRFEKVEKGYALEDEGGFFDSEKKEYSAGLLMGAVKKNDGTFNEDYSFTEAIISNRVIAVTKKGSKVKSFSDFAGAKAVVLNPVAKESFSKNTQLSSACAGVTEVKDLNAAFTALDSGSADVLITDEFTFTPSDKAKSYTVLEHELDRIDYVIACAKYSGWKDSINTAIYELKSPEYNDKDEFTPLVEKYFGYNASSFNYKPAEE